MQPRTSILTASLLFGTLSMLPAATLFWDGGTTDIPADGNGASAGGSGTWNTTLLNWDAGASPHLAWSNDNFDTASFGGTTGTVTLSEPITANALLFPSTWNWVITGSTLTLAGTTPTINHAGPTTINSIIDGTDGLNIAGGNPLTLGSANTYSGNTILGGGSLILNADGGIDNSDTLYFGATSGVSAAFGLTVNGNAAVGSLIVQMRNATASTISIASGKTLSVNGNLSVAGNSTTTTVPTKLTVSGSGTLAVAKDGGTMRVGNTSNANGAILDLSALAKFTADLGSTGKFFVGANTSYNGSGLGQDSTLTLSPDSTIAAGTLAISDHDLVPTSVTVTNTLKLGADTNTLNVDAIYMGGYETSGSKNKAKADLRFNSTSGTVKIRDVSGTGRTSMTVGVTSQSYNTTTATVDFGGHSADLLLSTLTIGKNLAGNPDAVLTTGTMTFNSGTLDATAAVLGINAKSAGTLNIGGGITTIGASGIVIGSGGTGTLNLTGGAVTLGGNITRSSGTGSMTLDGASLDMAGYHIGSATAMSTLNFNSGTLKNVGEINNGSTGLTKTGAGTLILDGSNTYSGDTIVAEGVLGVTGFSIPDTGKLTISGGMVAATGTEVVDTLYFGEAQQAPGKWGAPGTPGADFTDVVHFSGTAGLVKVTNGPAPGGSAFDTWATTTNGLSGPDAATTADPDNDGLKNSIEFVVGGQPNPANPNSNSSSLAPKVDVSSDPINLIFTFNRTDLSLTQPGIMIMVQYGSNLTNDWVNVVIPTITPGSPINGATVTIIDDGSGTGVDKVKVAIPKSLAVGSKMFARLNVEF